MTIEEARNKFAKIWSQESWPKFKMWAASNGASIGAMDKISAYMFKAGQDDQAQFYGEQLINQVAVIVKLRKALKQINDYVVTDSFDAVNEIREIAREALEK